MLEQAVGERLGRDGRVRLVRRRIDALDRIAVDRGNPQSAAGFGHHLRPELRVDLRNDVAGVGIEPTTVESR